MLAPALAAALLLAPPAAPAGGAGAVQEARADAVLELIAKGRARLDAGRPEDALPFLERADELSGGAFEPRFWRVRCLIARRWLNDAFDLVDALRERGLEDPGLDYLTGLALHARALEHIQQQVGGGLIELNFGDAVRYLSAATEAAPERFPDAWLPLAESAWYGQRNDVARAAAERAVALDPQGFDARYMLGRVAFSQYVSLRAVPGQEEQAAAHWRAAHDALARATADAGRPADPARRTVVAEAWLQLAYAEIWGERADQAAAPLSAAMALDPQVVNFRDLRTWLAPEAVLACLERGLAGYQEVHGPDAHGDSVIRWWIGWTHLAAGRWAAAEAAYMEALREEPRYADARWYVGLARYHRQDFDGAIAAVAAAWVAGPEAVTGAAATDREASLAILDYLVGRAQAAEPARDLEAAALAELQTSLAPEDARHWNNAGLFLYRAGQAVEPLDEDARERRRELFSRAFRAYERAVRFAPDEPGYLNDAAVVLHHGLRAELERARGMYARANELARARLAEPDLDAATRARLEQVARDSAANLAELEGRGGDR